MLFGILPVLLAFVVLASSAFSQKANADSYCGLLRSSQPTHDLVTTEAYMTYSTVSLVDGGDSFLYWPGCNNKDYFAVVSFAKKPSKALSTFFSRLPDEKNFILKVSVTGRFRSSFIPLFGHLSWTRLQFEIDSVGSIADVSNDPRATRPDFDAEAPLTESGEVLRDLNSEIIFSIFSGKVSQDIRVQLHASFVLVDQHGKEFAIDRLHLLSIEHLFGDDVNAFDRRAVQQPNVEIVGQDYVATGLFWIENAAGSRRSLEYRNIFRGDNSSFVLVRTILRSVPS